MLEGGARCLATAEEEEAVDRKFFLHNNTRQDVTVLINHRPETRSAAPLLNNWVSWVLKIFKHER